MLANARQLFAVVVVAAGLVACPAIAQTPPAQPTASVSGTAVLVPPANNTVNITASGTYNMGGFGAVTKITVQVRYKDEGDTNWTDGATVDATVPNPGVTGTFTALIQGVPYKVVATRERGNIPTQYQIKARLYQGTSPNFVLVGNSAWTAVPAPN
jgi:hypothetical protein